MQNLLQKQKDLENVDIPQAIIQRWQEPLDLLADVTKATVIRVIELDSPVLRLLATNQSQAGFFQESEIKIGHQMLISAGSICASVISMREQMYIPAINKDPRWLQSPEYKAGLVCYAGFPIVWPDNEPFGCVAMLSRHEDAFSEVYQRLLKQTRDIIEADLRILYQQTHDEVQANLIAQKQLFENLLAVARATNSHLSLDATLQNAVDVSAKLTSAEYGSLFLLDEKANVTHSLLARANSIRNKEEKQQVIKSVMEKGAAGWVALKHQTALISDTMHDDRWFNFPDQPYRVRSALILPIVRGPKLMGIMSLHHSQPNHFHHDHARLMQAAADQIALALENARLYSAIQQELIERRKAEQQLRESESRYRAVSEMTSDFTFSLTFNKMGDINVEWVTDAFTKITGFTPRELTEKGGWLSMVYKDDVPIAKKFAEKITKGYFDTVDFRIVTRHGDMRWLRIYGKPEENEVQAGWRRVVGAGQDISERKQAEEALQLANQQLRNWVNELEQHSREISMLNEMSDLFRVCRTAEETYKVISEKGPLLFPTENGALFTLTTAGNHVEAVSSWGKHEYGLYAPEDCWALRRGRVHLVENTANELTCRHLPEDFEGSYICVPMMAQGEALGFFHLNYNRPNALPENRRRLAITVAEHISLALANVRLQETLRSQSIRDPLTGLYNRRYMEEALEREIAQANRGQSVLTLVMLDLDHFKRFNDMYGHDAGDLVLRELGQVLQNYICGTNIACRYGGEEFILILPELNQEQALEQAQVVEQAIKRLKVQYRQRILGSLTVSMGIATYPTHGSTVEAVLLAADAALYQAKNEGRARIITWDAATSSHMFEAHE